MCCMFCKCVKTKKISCVLTVLFCCTGLSLHVSPYSVRSSRQRSPLDGGPTVTAVVPQDNLSRVSPPDHQVGMKPGKAHRYYRRLRGEKDGEGERMRQQNHNAYLWEKTHYRELTWTWWESKWSGRMKCGDKTADSEKRAKTKNDMKRKR